MSSACVGQGLVELLTPGSRESGSSQGEPWVTIARASPLGELGCQGAVAGGGNSPRDLPRWRRTQPLVIGMSDASSVCRRSPSQIPITLMAYSKAASSGSTV